MCSSTFASSERVGGEPAVRIATPLRTRLRPGAVVSLVLCFIGMSAGCARPVERAPLAGRVPATPAHVGTIALPHVGADCGATPFRFPPAAGHVLVVYFGYTT